MNRQRIAPARVARPAAISLGNAKPVLRSSTRLNQIKPSPTACMSYKELIKVVGVDCETGPSSWRKAIDHSAETVVFYQVDLRGILPRMCKSVRIRREEGTGENKELRLVPSVYVGDTLLSATYVKTIIGRNFLADEDDLMKLLEHAGILQEEEEIMEERNDDNGNDDWDVDAGKNDPAPTEPEPKRAKMFGNSLTASKSIVGERGRRARSGVGSGENDAASAQGTTSGRQAIDLSAMLLLEQIDQTPAILQAVEAEEDTAMDTDYDNGCGLPATDDSDELPFGFNSDDVFSSTGKMEEPILRTTKEDVSERDLSVEKTVQPSSRQRSLKTKPPAKAENANLMSKHLDLENKIKALERMVKSKDNKNDGNDDLFNVMKRQSHVARAIRAGLLHVFEGEDALIYGVLTTRGLASSDVAREVLDPEKVTRVQVALERWSMYKGSDELVDREFRKKVATILEKAKLDFKSGEHNPSRSS